jgi:phosphoribosylformylglycinamidine synthase
MTTLPTALVISAPGTNRDGDVALALELAGARPVHHLLGDVLAAPELARHAQLIVVPGGFSYADSLGAGRMFGLELQLGLGDVLRQAVDDGRPVIGICNGFQALVRTGLLPGAGRRVALGHNASGSFDCRWVQLAPVSQRCIWTAGLADDLACPIAHGEGRFTCTDEVLGELVAGDQIALRYRGLNPNGSVDDIAGICDPSGLVLGLMPHPEDHVLPRQHPRHRRYPESAARSSALPLFRNGVARAAAS